MATDCLLPVYLEASWKGMAFHVETSSDEFGRRGEVYEYPLGEQTGYKDLGRKARRFKIEGYLIGGDQISQTNTMAMAAESPEPGMLIHPMFGPQLVACVTLTSSADYKKEVRRTKLSFDFVEAMPSMAPYLVGAAISALFADGSDAMAASTINATWVPTPNATTQATAISVDLSYRITPAIDEASYDAISMLERGAQSTINTTPIPPTTAAIVVGGNPYQNFSDVIGPIDNGSATIRRLHTDAMARLRSWNSIVVAASDNTPSVESMIVTARLTLVRDFALVSAQTIYTTVRDALRDLDFIMAVYDEEEAFAVKHCDDVLVTSIRKARATAARTILAQNIQLPGISESSTDGVWPSLVVAHKLYFDGRRYLDVESYNPQMNPYFVGRSVIAPSV